MALTVGSLGGLASELTEAIRRLCDYARAALPAVFPIAAAGFLKIHGMTLTQYLKARRNVREHPVYYFKPALIGMMEKEDGTYGHKNAGQGGGKKLKKKQQKKQKIILISEGDEGT